MSQSLERANGIIRPSSYAVSCALGDGAAILDTRDNRYYSLNPVGAFIWERLGQGATREALVSAVLDTFEVEEPRCRADIDRILSELDEAGLIDHAPVP